MSFIYLHKFEMKNGSKKIISETNMEIPEGRYTLKGPNGCGKSTFLRVISGLQNPSRGSINRELSCDLVSDCIVFPSEMTVKTILSLYERYRKVDAAMQSQLIESLDLNQYVFANIGALSQGTQQKIRLLIGLSTRDGWLLLDEPFNGLDDRSVNVLNDIISRIDRPMIIVDHSGQLDLTEHSEIVIKNFRLCINL